MLTTRLTLYTKIEYLLSFLTIRHSTAPHVTALTLSSMITSYGEIEYSFGRLHYSQLFWEGFDRESAHPFN